MPAFPCPMDIEWAKDGADGKLYIIQARPETVASQRSPDVYETYDLKGSGTVIVTGRAVGKRSHRDPTRRIATARDLAAFKPGEILVAPSTSPDWEPVMKIAAGVITDKGGRTCHAAIVARELGIPAVVGATHATEKLKTGTNVTICCAEGEIGNVYQGKVAFDVTRTPVSELRQPHTAIMVNVGTPEMAFRMAMQPQAGVGLARMEFIISEHIGIHPMALLKPEMITSAKSESAIARLVKGYQEPFRFLHPDAGGRRRHDCRSILSQAGDCSAFRLQDQRVRQPARRRGVRAEGGEPDAGIPRRFALQPPRLRRGFRAGMRGAAPGARGHGSFQFAYHGAVLPTVEEGRRVIATMAANGLKRGERRA